MKVIIQDIAAREFLGENGEWVSDKSMARNFHTLLRAYHFAQSNTSIHFRVLLHCPDDDYSASIIEGFGIADEDLGFCAAQKKNIFEIREQIAQGFDVKRLHLN